MAKTEGTGKKGPSPDLLPSRTTLDSVILQGNWRLWLPASPLPLIIAVITVISHVFAKITS